MEDKLLESVGGANGIGGIVLVVFLFLFQRIRLPQANQKQIDRYMLLIFSLAVIAIFAYVGIQYLETKTKSILREEQRSGGGLLSEDPAIRTANELRREFQRATEGKKPPINRSDFDRVRELISILRQLDPQNGHALYFSGQMNRWEGALEDAQSDFYRYLEYAESRKLTNITLAEECYRSPDGYCRQRSGYICHLLANDFFQRGVTEVNNSAHYFAVALTYERQAVGFFPGGFEQFTPSKVLLQELPRRIALIQSTEPTSKH